MSAAIGAHAMNMKLKRLTYLLPTPLRNLLKRAYVRGVFFGNSLRHVRKGRFAYVGSCLRFSRQPPFRATLGAGSHAEEFNIWDAQSGDIHIGDGCFLGLHNVIMGPVQIGNKVSTGPFVCILGPRHALYEYESGKEGPTRIGNGVWISTGAIVHFGVSIGDYAVIAPGAVVTRDVPNRAYVAGNPARDITKVSGLEELMRKRGDAAGGAGLDNRAIRSEPREVD